MARPTKPARRTQQERREETRGKLLDATVECLVRYGYSGTTTTLVSERAGVSRGAQLHHFPRKAELVRAAVEHVFDRRVAEFREAMARLPEGKDRLGSAIDLLWEAYSEGGAFYPSLEFMVAARTEPEIRDEVHAVSRGIVDEVREIFTELFGESAATSPFGELAPGFALIVMDGLALAQLGGLDDEGVRSVLEGLKSLGALIQLGSGAEPP